MKLTLSKPKENIVATCRRIGYMAQRTTEFNEHAFVRELSRGGYPRFHLYIKETTAELIFNLHLDQRKPVYAGQTAHSGEYDGELVEEEIARIKDRLVVKSQPPEGALGRSPTGEPAKNSGVKKPKETRSLADLFKNIFK